MSCITQVRIYQFSPAVLLDSNSLWIRARIQPRPQTWEEEAAAIIGHLALNEGYDEDRD